MSVASLPMYRFAHTGEAWDALWTLIARALEREGIDAPPALVQPGDLDSHWRDPDLLISQTCAMPYRQGLWRDLQVLGAWDLGLKGCAPGQYNSVILRRKGAARPWRTLLREGRVAVNATHSQSGYQVLCDLLGHPPETPLVTGAHRASAAALREGRADLCAIDAESWRLIVEEAGGAEPWEVCHRTDPSPGLPLVTPRGRDPAPLRRAVAHALTTAPPSLRATLHLRGFVPCDEARYLA